MDRRKFISNLSALSGALLLAPIAIKGVNETPRRVSNTVKDSVGWRYNKARIYDLKDYQELSNGDAGYLESDIFIAIDNSK